MANEEEVRETESKISLSTKDLQNIIKTAVAAAVETTLKKNEEGFQKIADTLVESRRPWKDPKAEANEETFRKSTRELQERLRKNLIADQATCQHLQGSNSLSDFPSPHGLTCIIHHYLDTGELVGVCENCNRIFRSGDPDYNTWMAKKSGCRASAAGRRWFADPIAAIRAGQS